MTHETLRPARALAHPAWWVALGVLAVNDHLLKGTAVLPQPVIGKLSDFAGLLVAPALLAALLRLRRPGAVAAAHLATAAVFALINLSPAAAAAFEGLMAHTPWPWAIYVDPTDLLALPMVALSWALFVPWMVRPIAVAPALQRGAAIVGGWACVATSPPPEPPIVEPPVPGPTTFPDVSDRLMYANDRASTVLLRVRPLRPEVELDCAAVAEDPGARLSPELFGPAVAWELAPGRALGLLQANPAGTAPRSGCDAWRVDGAGVAGRVVFVPQGTWPVTPLSTSAAAVPAVRRLAITELGWGEHLALFELPRSAPELPSPECRLPAVGAGMDWTSPPGEAVTVLSKAVSPDGCNRLLVDVEGWQEPWYLCLGGEPLPFDEGARLQVALLNEGLQITDERTRLTLLRGAELGTRFVVNDVRDEEGCLATVDRCGQWREPIELRVTERATELAHWLGTGDRVELDTATVRVVRAERLVVNDPTCSRPTTGLEPGVSHALELVITEDLQE
ncbi:MAG: hypothetical protein H6702_11105 [Myxococcales bacterium]|nr:hypothetical protein [Myxococcales bacterium]